MGRGKAPSPGQLPHLHPPPAVAQAPEKDEDQQTLPAKATPGLPPLAPKPPVADVYFLSPTGRNPRHPRGKATSASPAPAKLSHVSRSLPPKGQEPAQVNLPNEALMATEQGEDGQQSSMNWMERTQQSLIQTQRSTKFSTSFRGSAGFTDQEKLKPKPSASSAEKVYAAPVVPGMPSNRLRSRRPRRQNGGMLPQLTRPLLRHLPKEATEAREALREKVLETLENVLIAETLPVDVQTRVLQAVDQVFSDFSRTMTVRPDELQGPVEIQEPTLPQVSLVPRPPAAEKPGRRPGPRFSFDKVNENSLEIQLTNATSPAPHSEVTAISVTTLSVAAESAAQDVITAITAHAGEPSAPPTPPTPLTEVDHSTGSEVAAEISEMASMEIVAGVMAAAQAAVAQGAEDPQSAASAQDMASEELDEMLDFAGDVVIAFTTKGLSDFLFDSEVLEAAEVDFLED